MEEPGPGLFNSYSALFQYSPIEHAFSYHVAISCPIFEMNQILIWLDPQANFTSGALFVITIELMIFEQVTSN